MTSHIEAKAHVFEGINRIALHGEIVVFGSTYMSNFPFYELTNKCHLEHAIYNRSIEGLTTEDAEMLLKTCVLDMKPHKIFLQLGEEDISAEEAIQHYKTILAITRNMLPRASIYLISIPETSAKSAAFNHQLLKLCDKKHIFYVSIASGISDKASQYTVQFKQLAHFFRDSGISLSESFSVADF